MTDTNIAVLIDADNVSYKHIGGLMAEIANIGKASVRRIYSDWTIDQMKGWKECLLNAAVRIHNRKECDRWRDDQ